MAMQLQERAGISQRIHDQPSPSLYEVIAANGPLTSCGLASTTPMSRFFAAGWLERQVAAGYLHFDKATGRYWVACPLPHRTPEGTPRPGALRRVVEKVLDYAALAWFGLLGDHGTASNNSQPRQSIWQRLFEDPRSPLVIDAMGEAAWLHDIGEKEARQ